MKDRRPNKAFCNEGTGRAVVEATGLNPAGDLNGCEPFVNKVCEENAF